MSGEISGTLYSVCEGYSIDPDTFQEWFSSHFLRPLLLILEESPSVVNIQHLADRESIVLFAKSTNLDPGPFSVFRATWKKVVQDHTSHGGELKRHEFCPLFSEVWQDTLTIDAISTGFKESKVCPFANN